MNIRVAQTSYIYFSQFFPRRTQCTIDFWDKTQSIALVGSSTRPRWWAGVQSRDPRLEASFQILNAFGRSGLGFSLPCLLSPIRVDKPECCHCCQRACSLSPSFHPSFPSFSLKPQQTAPLPVKIIPGMSTPQKKFENKTNFFTIKQVHKIKYLFPSNICRQHSRHMWPRPCFRLHRLTKSLTSLERSPSQSSKLEGDTGKIGISLSVIQAGSPQAQK